MSVRFELVATVPWSDAAPELIVDPLGGRGDERVRVPPGVLRDARDRVWLIARDGRAAWLDGGVARAVPLAAAALRPRAIVPDGDGGVIVLGEGRDGLALARVGGDGALRWRRVLARDEAAGADGLEADLSGGVFVVPSSRGPIRRIALDGGATELVDRAPSPPRCAFGRRAWVERRAGAPAWIVRGPGADERATPVPPRLRDAFGARPGLLSDGGALIRDGRTLVWMRPGGEVAGFVAFGGAVRDGDALLIAVRRQGALAISRWRNGAGEDVAVVATDAPHAELVAAGAELTVELGGDGRPPRLRPHPRTPALHGEEPSTAAARLAHATLVDLGDPAIGAAGDLLVAGAEPGGIFILRIGVPYA
jgi:hypothetical protein